MATTQANPANPPRIVLVNPAAFLQWRAVSYEDPASTCNLLGLYPADTLRPLNFNGPTEFYVRMLSVVQTNSTTGSASALPQGCTKIKATDEGHHRLLKELGEKAQGEDRLGYLDYEWKE